MPEPACTALLPRTCVVRYRGQQTEQTDWREGTGGCARNTEFAASLALSGPKRGDNRFDQPILAKGSHTVGPNTRRKTDTCGKIMSHLLRDSRVKVLLQTPCLQPGR